MSVSSTNYAQPVQVNGYTCKNCTDVDNAKKHIDPAHPASGPYNVNAATDPTRKTAASATADTPAVSFGGTLAALNAVQAGAGGATSGKESGARLNLQRLAAGEELTPRSSPLWIAQCDAPPSI